ncbi:MAG TPA: hypothetical protein VLA64_07800 [Azonexus sp.]|nr:hypothetical protein [Azonexus sp.]
MNTNLTTTDALALNMADITAFTLPIEIDAADHSSEGASWADAMATIGTCDPREIGRNLS